MTLALLPPIPVFFLAPFSDTIGSAPFLLLALAVGAGASRKPFLSLGTGCAPACVHAGASCASTAHRPTLPRQPLAAAPTRWSPVGPHTPQTLQTLLCGGNEAEGAHVCSGPWSSACWPHPPAVVAHLSTPPPRHPIPSHQSRTSPKDDWRRLRDVGGTLAQREVSLAC